MPLLEIFSDYVCPFCRLGDSVATAFKASRPEVEIRWRAFELRPEPAPLTRLPAEYRDMMWVRSIYPMASKLRVKMRMPSFVPRTRLAHEAAAWAGSQGALEVMHNSIFRAYFEDGQDVGQPEVLVKLAAEAGLDGAGLQTALEQHTGLNAVLADEELAAQHGLTGVPAFVCDGRLAVGVPTPKSLEQLVFPLV